MNQEKSIGIKIAKHIPGKMFIVYTHNAGEAWQEVNIGQRETVGVVYLRSQYSARRPITSVKLKDLQNLCSYIPGEYRGFYTGLQATSPCPRKPRAVVLPQRTEDKTSASESDIEVPSSDCDNDE